jgi:hypothetical protein
MNEGLLIIERMIIESLSRKEKNIFELSSDTTIDQSLLLNVLPNLLMKNHIKYLRGIYSIDKESSLLWSTNINLKENVKEETKEIFLSLVNQFYQKEVKELGSMPQLKLQKMWLTHQEEVVLRSHLNGLESFFHSVKESRKKFPMKEKTAEQKIIFWGCTNYSDLVSGVLEAV